MSYITKIIYDVISPDIQSYQKRLRYNIFQYEIPDRMSYLKTLYDNFESFRQKIFKRERMFQKPLAFCEFSPDFQSGSGFDLTKDRRIEMRGPRPALKKKSLLPSL